MSVDFQDEIQEDWDKAAVPPKTGTDESATVALKYANLNEALDEAGVAMGDLRANLPIAFRFTWHRMSVFCEIAENGGEAALILETDLGPLPYSIENQARREYFQQLHDPRTVLPIGEFTITERRRFRHRVKRPLTEPITGGGIVTAVVQALLTARPYHQLAKAG